MKGIFLISAAALLLASAARADSLVITSVTEMGQPTGTITSTGNSQFKGQNAVVFTAFGKACKWAGSAAGSAPQGCNYSITINTSHESFSNPGSNGGSGNICTPSSQMLALCH